MKIILLISILFLLFFRNLSAYQEISIQKNDQLNDYADLVLLINKSVSNEDIKNLIGNNIYNINFSQNLIRFEFDLISLSNDLEKNNIQNNLLFLNCSLNKNFFNFNFNNLDCPNFKLIKFNSKNYIFLKFKNNLFRIKEFNQNDDLRSIWINLLEIKSSSYLLTIDSDNYNNFLLLTDYSPKILDYKNNKINIDIKSIYSPNQYNFLLNFFK